MKFIIYVTHFPAMLAHFEGLSEELAQRARNADSRSRENFDIETEDTLAVRFLEAFSQEVEDYAVTNPFNLDIHTYKLRDRGPNAAESHVGADFIISYTFQLSNFEFSQGILVQAKKESNTNPVSASDMSDQCDRMLRWSPAAFIYIFSSRANRSFPALQISSTQTPEPRYSGQALDFSEAYGSRTTLQFFRLFFNGFVGDNWVYRNTRFLTDPANTSPNNRPLAPDGGESESNEDRSGAKALTIAISSPDRELELPFNPNDSVESFKGGSASSYEW